MSANNIGFICTATRDGKPYILQKLVAKVNCDATNYSQFLHMLNDIKRQIHQKNTEAETVTVVRPALLRLAKSMEDWLSPEDAGRKRHIGTCCIIRDKNDPEFRWPVFMLGKDVADENNRQFMLDCCKKVSLSRVANMDREIYVQDGDVYVFTQITSPIWTDNFLSLCEHEAQFAASPENFKYFLEAV